MIALTHTRSVVSCACLVKLVHMIESLPLKFVFFLLWVLLWTLLTSNYPAASVSGKENSVDAVIRRCDRVRSQDARRIIKENFFLPLRKTKLEISKECIFLPQKDVLFFQESRKKTTTGANHQCGFCKKTFRNSWYLDKHLGRHHLNETSMDANICVADLCDHMIPCGARANFELRGGTLLRYVSPLERALNQSEGMMSTPWNFQRIHKGHGCASEIVLEERVTKCMDTIRSCLDTEVNRGKETLKRRALLFFKYTLCDTAIKKWCSGESSRIGRRVVESVREGRYFDVSQGTSSWELRYLVSLAILVVIFLIYILMHFNEMADAQSNLGHPENSPMLSQRPTKLSKAIKARGVVHRYPSKMPKKE